MASYELHMVNCLVKSKNTRVCFWLKISKCIDNALLVINYILIYCAFISFMLLSVIFSSIFSSSGDFPSLSDIHICTCESFLNDTACFLLWYLIHVWLPVKNTWAFSLCCSRSTLICTSIHAHHTGLQSDGVTRTQTHKCILFSFIYRTNCRNYCTLRTGGIIFFCQKTLPDHF